MGWYVSEKELRMNWRKAGESVGKRTKSEKIRRDGGENVLNRRRNGNNRRFAAAKMEPEMRSSLTIKTGRGQKVRILPGGEGGQKGGICFRKDVVGREDSV